MNYRDVREDERLSGALRTAFQRAPDLQPRDEFSVDLRERLRGAAVTPPRASAFPVRWLALAAGLVLAAAVTAALLLKGPTAPADALALDAIGDHKNCALKFRLVRAPIPLEDAAQRFDSAYRVLLNAPADDTPTPAGPVHVMERHSCAYGDRRFGHIVLRYRGHVVSLLVTANDGGAGAAASMNAVPHVIGRPVDGLSVVSVNASRHAIVLVGDLGRDELTELSRQVSLPLLPRLGGLVPRGAPTAWLLVPPSMSAPDLPHALVQLPPQERP